MNHLKSVILAASLGFASLVQAQTIQDGQKYLDIEQFGRAGTTFHKILATDPSAKNNYYTGYYYLRVQKPDSAIQFFNAGLAKDPKFALNHVGLGAAAVAKGNKADANKHFNMALEISKSKDAEVMFAIGEAYTIYPTTDAVEAIKKLEAATKLNPKVPEYFLMLGDAYLLQNEGTKANENYELKALPLNKNLAKTYIKQGKLMERARNYNEAATKYKEGLAKDTGYSPGYKELGELYSLANRPELALENYEKYIKRSDKNPATMLMYADFLLRNKKYPEALAILKELEVTNKSPLIYRGFAFAQYETGAYNDGLTSMQKLFASYDSTQVRPKDFAKDQDYYGKLLIKSGKDTAGGIARIHRAIQLDSSNALQTRKDLAKLLFDAKKYKLAADEQEQIIRSPKSVPFDIFDYGKTLFFAKEYVKSDTTVGTYLTKVPNSQSALNLKALIASRLDPSNKTWRAKPWYEKYIASVKPEEVEKQKKPLISAYKYLGSYYLFQKDKPKLDEYYKKVLELDPNDQSAKDALNYDPNKPAGNKK